MTRTLLRPGQSWEEMRTGFVWHVPESFNIAAACCDSWARVAPQRVALTHLGADRASRDWSYGALRDASDRLARAMAARGLGRGDRVAVYLPQGPEVLIAHFAAMKLGAVSLPLFTLFGEEALIYRLDDSGAKMLVTDGENLDKIVALRDRLPDLAEIWCIDGSAPPVRTFWDEIGRAAAGITPAPVGAEDPAVMIYTSGTTGAAKGVLHAHRFLLGHLPNIELHHEFFPQPGDVGWTPADWAWIGGLMDMALPCLYYGVPLISRRMRKFDPDEAYALIAARNVRNLFLPPTALKLMRQAQVPAGIDIRTVGSGGESLGAEMLDWGREALGAPINEFYGQTECNLVIATSSAAMEVKPGAMGKAVPGSDVAVIDAEGQETPDGQTGEIVVRRGMPAMFLRYWKKPEATEAKFTGDWMRTGDLGVRDGEGYFTYVSRDDDVITSAGYRIGPSEIENCLAGHPDVVMAACIGVPDPLRGEVVKAFVVLRDGAEWEGLEAALIARVREKVSPHVAPRVVARIGALPMTATGKIMRRELRERC